MGDILNDVMARYGSDNPDLPVYGYYQISAKVKTDHYAMMYSLINAGIVQNKTDALRLLIEAGYSHLTRNLPHEVGDLMETHFEDCLEALREKERNAC